MKLLNQQKEAVSKLQQHQVGAMFMDPGTGKTRSALELINGTESDYILWFTPFRTKENLRTEIEKWGTDKNIEIIGIESIQNSDRLYLQLYKKISVAWCPAIIVDESLKIKNADSKRTKRIIKLGKMAHYKLILNGTPLSRDLLDLWSQLEFLSPKILKMGLQEFKNKFCEYKTLTITKSGTYRTQTKEWIIRYHNLDYLYAMIEPYVYECDLQIDINKQYHEIKYCLSTEEKEKHTEIIERILDDKWLMAKPNFFLELTQYLQNNYSRSEEKFQYLDEIVQKYGAKKIIVFAKYIATQELLKERFPEVQILSYQKHSFGLNLQQYNICVFFDKHWDYALREQAERRIYRTGQNKECIFYDLTGNVGLEDMISNNVAKKADLLQEFKKLSLDEFKKKAI